tara:strand:- start:65 stop:250 length:186 start_codon:yes stop_codon:yes gene_type:complete
MGYYIQIEETVGSGKLSYWDGTKWVSNASDKKIYTEIPTVGVTTSILCYCNNREGAELKEE